MEANNNFIEILDKYIKKDKINHAYLIETNSINRIDLAFLLIRKIFQLDDKNITIEDLIKNNDLFIIKTDLQYIKKEEIINLKDNFKTKSLFFGKRVYIIEEAEKLNSSSANTLLKFLEEPDDEIYAVLITNNKYNLIDTILSRCQEIRYYENNSDIIELKYLDNILDLFVNIEENKVKAIAFINKYITKDMFERTIFQQLLEEMLCVYYDILQFKVNLDVVYSSNQLDKVKYIADNNSFEELNRKILSINKGIEKNKINGNTKLIMDNIIIDMFGGE